jgi:hypothetical protein
VRSTEYSHLIHIDESAGRFDFDCSGFVDYAMSNVAPDALDALRHSSHKKRPTADSYENLLRTITPGGHRGRWMHVAHVADVQAGDVVAWIATTTTPDDLGAVNTGHVMIVDGPARERVPGEWVVPILDSSGGHGGTDTRKKGQSTGLGRGTVVLVERDGYVRGYHWTESPRSPMNETSVMLGRIE